MKNLFLSISMVLIISANISFSNDTTSCKFFPLHIGDLYLYKIIHISANGPPTVYNCDTTYKYTKIICLRTIGNKNYFYCTNILIDGYLYNYYLRYDSTTGYLERYDSTAAICDFKKTLYKLSANINDTLGNFCTELINYSYQSCDTILMLNCFGVQTICKSFYCFELGTTINSCNTKLANGFGTYLAQQYYSYSVPGHYGYSDHYYFLVGAQINGIIYGDTTMPTIIKTINNEISSSFSLSQNYPNPFNPVTNIKYQITNSKLVILKIYNILGKEIETLVNEKQSPGTYEVIWNAGDYPSGVYFYKLTAGDFTETKKMVLLK